MPSVAAQGVKVVQIARVGEAVEVDDRLARLGNSRENDVGSDEAGAACRYQHLLRRDVV